MLATVFGLDVSANIHLPFLQQAPAEPTGRRLEISVAAGSTATPGWLDSGESTATPGWPDSGKSVATPGWPDSGESVATPGWRDSAEVVCDQRDLDGGVNFRIEAHPQAGYLIWGPTYGRHILSADGRRVLCMPGGCAEDAWQRLLIAQVLPFAALLRGLEVFHSSAVVIEQSAIAFLGPSHAGKTSVALALCRLGAAAFLADDVLALERSGDDLLGHPGTPVAGLDHAEAQALAQAGDPRRDEVVALNERERLVRMRGACKPAPLAALFFLDRRPDGPERPRFEAAADAQMLLTATFNFVLATPERLRGLLEVCALAARLRVERVLVGPRTDARELAAAVEQRLSSAT